MNFFRKKPVAIDPDLVLEAELIMLCENIMRRDLLDGKTAEELKEIRAKLDPDSDDVRRVCAKAKAREIAAEKAENPFLMVPGMFILIPSAILGLVVWPLIPVAAIGVWIGYKMVEKSGAFRDPEDRVAGLIDRVQETLAQAQPKPIDVAAIKKEIVREMSGLIQYAAIYESNRLRDQFKGKTDGKTENPLAEARISSTPKI